ncbi:MAG: RluA family pseudouridine synthase [Patescibacteria group bacterium]
MQSINVPESARGERLDRFLVAQGFVGSRTQLQRTIARGEITVDEKPVPPHHFLKGGEIITIQENAPVPPTTPPHFKDIRLVHNDEHFAVIEKPTGVLVHPAKGTNEKTLLDWLAEHVPESAHVGTATRPGIVHRLDREVSGLLVVAKTQEGFDELHAAFHERRVKKSYIALLHGVIQKESGVITFHIRRSKTTGRMAAVPENDPEARSAETHYEVMRVFTHATQASIHIITGRSHQIRVHFYALGHPVIGDMVYHPKGISGIPAERLYLHAVELSFPFFGTLMGPYTSPLPEAFSRLMALLSKGKQKS